MKNDGQEGNRRFFVQNADTAPRIPQALQAEKFSMTVLSPDSANQNTAATESSVAGGRSSPAVTSSREGGKNPAQTEDPNLRQEVEQLRRVVETLSAQQQQPQVVQVYQQGHGNLPDEPPPMYN